MKRLITLLVALAAPFAPAQIFNYPAQGPTTAQFLTVSNAVGTNMLTLSGAHTVTGTNRFAGPVTLTNTGNTISGNGAGLTGLVASAYLPLAGGTMTGVISSPGAGSTSERFGSGATAGGLRSMGFGVNATSAGQDAVVLGWSASGGGISAVAVGSQANASADYSTAVGYNAVATNTSSTAVGSQSRGSYYGAALGQGADGSAGNYSITIGAQAISSAGFGIAIGSQSTVAHAGSMAVGQAATTTAAGQLVFGSANNAFSTGYLGSGVVNAAPTSFALNATGGSGTDIAGANLTLNAGRGTGSGSGGYISFGTAPAGSTGSALNSVVERMRLSATGVLGVQSGGTATLAKVGGVIFDHYADAASTSTDGTEDVLYTDTLAAATLGSNGDKVMQVEHVSFVAHATAARRLRKYFAGTAIFDSGTLTLAAGADVSLSTFIIRESASVVRVLVTVTTTSVSTVPYVTRTRITGLTLGDSQILKTTGTASGAGAAAADIVNTQATGQWLPAF